MAQRKAEEVKKREEEMKQAAQLAKGNYDQAKFARQQATYDHMMRVKGAANVEAFDHKAYESFTVNM